MAGTETSTKEDPRVVKGRVMYNGRPRGFITKDGSTFIKNVNYMKHFAVRHQGYGIQSSILGLLGERGVECVQLNESLPSGSVKTYVVPLALWTTRGIEDVLREQDGKQVFLAVRFFPKGVLTKTGGGVGQR